MMPPILAQIRQPARIMTLYLHKCRHRIAVKLAIVVSGIVFSTYLHATDIANDSATESASDIATTSETQTEPAASGSVENLTLDDALQQLKTDVLALNRDLFILKEELLFPAHTQVAVFLSLDVGEFFELDAVTVTLDDKQVASHLYTPKQTNALIRGGVQRLFLGNVKSGPHEIVAVFTGRGPQGRDYRRASSLDFAKSEDAKYLEVKIIDSTKLLQPEFSIKEWE